MTKILYVNHEPAQCGVWEAGDRLGRALEQRSDERYHFFYHYIDSQARFEYHLNMIQPDALFFNYFPSTIGPWCTPQLCDTLRSIGMPMLAICHEQQQLPPILEQFQYAAVLDPTFESDDPRVLITRNGVPDYTPNITAPNPIPVFGSFGFGFANKGWIRVLEKVNEEYDMAYIRLHIPKATFGDSDGAHMDARIREAQSFGLKPDVKLEISTDYKSEANLIDWLSGNDCNCFFYDDMPNRGVSSTTDYALAARKPLAITGSAMFKHLTVDGIRIEETTLHDIVARGTEPLEPLYQYTMDWVVDRYKNFFDEKLGADK